MNHAFRTLKHYETVPLIDLVPRSMRTRPAVLNNFIDIVSFFGVVKNVPEPSSRYLRVMRNNISQEQVERRVNAVQTILWYAVSHYGYPVPPENRADLIDRVGQRLHELQFPRIWDRGVLACLSLTELFGSEKIVSQRSNVIPFPKGNMALEEQATHIAFKGDERDLDDSLEQFFQIPRYRELGAILRKGMDDLKWAHANLHFPSPEKRQNVSLYLGALQKEMPNVAHRLIPHEHEEARGWTIRRVPSKAPLHKSTKDKFQFQDIGDARNPDLVGFRFDAVNAIASADLETLAVEVKKSFGEFEKRTIAQAQSYLEFANIVYMAVYADASALLQKKILINLISRLGIGLVAKKDGKDHWTEVIQPRYNFVRGSLKSYFLEHFFQGETGKIRGMITSAVQELQAEAR